MGWSLWEVCPGLKVIFRQDRNLAIREGGEGPVSLPAGAGRVVCVGKEALGHQQKQTYTASNLAGWGGRLARSQLGYSDWTGRWGQNEA